MDDLISRRAVIDAVHTATYGFICGAEDGDEMTDADKLVLSINKAICGAIKALPTVHNTFNALSALDCVARQAAIDAVRNQDAIISPISDDVLLVDKAMVMTELMMLPSVHPEKMQLSEEDATKDATFDCISRQHAILAIERNAYRREDINETEHIIKWVLDIIKWLPSTQELISEAHDTAWLDGYTAGQDAQSEYVALHESCTDCPLYDRKNHNCPRFNRVIPTAIRDAQPEDWMERNKERILQAGMEGREIEFRIGGRLFAIREKAQ